MLELRIKKTKEKVTVYFSDREGCKVWQKSLNTFQYFAWKSLVPLDYDFSRDDAKKQIKQIGKESGYWETTDELRWDSQAEAIEHQVFINCNLK